MCGGCDEFAKGLERDEPVRLPKRLSEEAASLLDGGYEAATEAVREHLKTEDEKPWEERKAAADLVILAVVHLLKISSAAALVEFAREAIEEHVIEIAVGAA